MSFPTKRRKKLKKSGISLIHRRSMALLLAALLCACLGLPRTGMAQSKKNGEEDGRTVAGVVTTPDDAAIAGAVVYLKNTKTLQVRSFITDKNGSYFFHGLSADVDYELRAENKGVSSSTKTLSSFDTRKTPSMNLQIKTK